MYCGHEWDAIYYSHAQVEAVKCIKCGDSTLKVKNTPTKANYYGYEDSPIANPPDAWIRKK